MSINVLGELEVEERRKKSAKLPFARKVARRYRRDATPLEEFICVEGHKLDQARPGGFGEAWENGE